MHAILTSCFYRVRVAGWAGVDLDQFPHLKKWVARIEERPATIAALKVPEQDMLTSASLYFFRSWFASTDSLIRRAELKNDPEAEERMAKEASAWVMKGNETK
jgi:hypothetical protein